jgi:hypothetical protein
MLYHTTSHYWQGQYRVAVHDDARRRHSSRASWPLAVAAELQAAAAEAVAAKAAAATQLAGAAAAAGRDAGRRGGSALGSWVAGNSAGPSRTAARLTVVLDMDECLIHTTDFSDDASSGGYRQHEASRDKAEASDVETFQLRMADGVTATVHKRPGLDGFLAGDAVLSIGDRASAARRSARTARQYHT